MGRCFLVALTAVTLFLTATPLPAQERVKQIDIKSYWLGLGDKSRTELTIQHIGPAYQLHGYQEDVPLILRKRGDRDKGKGPVRFPDQQVASDLLDALAAAVNQGAVDEPDAQNLGVTREYLETIVGRVTTATSRYSLKSGTTEQKALFRNSFTNPELIAKTLPVLFRGGHTDDYPSVDVAVTFEDGSVVTLRSGSQSVFMLPWKLVRRGESVLTFNARLARAIAALMPPQSTNRSRIAGIELDSQLAEAVMDTIENEWKLLGTERLGPNEGVSRKVR
jgi:hypothetical protein